MGILINPQYSPNSAYRPNVFITGQASANVIETAQAVVTINGTAVATLDGKFYAENPAGTYQFYFDLQQLLALNLAPLKSTTSEVFNQGALNAAFAAFCADSHAEYSIAVSYRYRDPTTGLLLNLPATDTSTNYYAIPATRQHEDNMAFTRFFPNDPILNQRWLTNAPNPQPIALDENQFLAYIGSTTTPNGIRVRTYDSAGVQIEEGIFDVPTSATYKIIGIGVGFPQLLLQTYTSGGITTSTNVAYYVVDLIFKTTGNRFLETRRYDITDYCADSIRLHFYNLLGGADAFTFKKVAKKRINVKSTVGQVPLPWATVGTPHAINSKGAFKLSTDGAYSYEVETGNIDDATAQWLAEILTSVEVYRETPSGLVPVIVNTDSAEVETNTAGSMNLTNIRFEFTDANGVISQMA